MSYQLVIWLEIHCKLKSLTKLFCTCINEQDFDTLKPNTHICPVCTAQPGWLPSLQKEPVYIAVKLAHCLSALVHPQSQFDRKSYFYPDLPSGFQITQFYRPYCTDGIVQFYTDNYRTSHTITIKEAHLETDTGKSTHTQNMGLIDFNRAGTPLVEIVTNPDFRSADQVIEFLKELQRIVRYNNISDADLEKWHLRCDVNLSIMPEWSSVYGTRVELKNINSYSSIKSAIEYEYHRQVDILIQGGSIQESTRGRDTHNNQTFAMRSKETTNDYRYFAEPDLQNLYIDETLSQSCKWSIAEIPYLTITRLAQEYGFHKEYINALIGDKSILDYFQEVVTQGYEPKKVAKRLCGPISAWCNAYTSGISKIKFDQSDFICFLGLIDQHKLNDTQAKMVIESMLDTGEKSHEVVHHLGFDIVQSIPYEDIADQVITQNSKVVTDYQWGKTTAIAFLVWQIMKISEGKADPKTAKEVLEKKLQNI